MSRHHVNLAGAYGLAAANVADRLLREEVLGQQERAVYLRIRRLGRALSRSTSPSLREPLLPSLLELRAARSELEQLAPALFCRPHELRSDADPERVAELRLALRRAIEARLAHEADSRPAVAALLVTAAPPVPAPLTLTVSSAGLEVGDL